MVIAFLLMMARFKPRMTESEAPAASSASRSAGGVREKPAELLPASAREPEGPEAVEAFYADGTRSARWELNADRQTGVLRIYHREGGVWIEAQIREGRLHGYFRRFHPSGILYASEQYELGQRSGDNQFLYPEGGAWVIWRVRDGLLMSRPTLFSENGKEERPLVMSDGGGHFKAFDPEGKLITEWSGGADGGRSTLRTFYADGRVSSEWELNREILQGGAELYDREGNRFWRAEFENGQLVRENGRQPSLEMVFEFEEGRRRYWRVFYLSGAPLLELRLDEPAAQFVLPLRSDPLPFGGGTES